MFIRIQLEDIESDKTKETFEFFCGNPNGPNGLFLSSLHAHMVSYKKTKIQNVIAIFWYVDVNILTEHYGGAIKCRNELLAYPGVGRVDILPIVGGYDTNDDKSDDLNTILMRYVELDEVE